jgi:hypothetical protein
MPYQKTIWTNREVERPRTFTMQDNGDGTITLIPAEGQIIEPGTPIIAQTMNKIEETLEAYDILLTSMTNTANLSGNGWFKDKKTGLIFQWGRIQNTNGVGGVQIDYPTMFPSEVFSCVAFPYDTTLADQGAYAWVSNSMNRYNAYVRSSKACYINWIAVGR